MMNRDGQALLDDLGLTHQHITFLGDVQVRDEDEIGRGSDAIVYRVNWQGIDIALKVLHPVFVEPGVQDRERKLRAFGQEVFRLSRVHHPNLCQLIGLARVRGNAALALELLSASLEDASIGDGREDAPKLVSYLCDASAGLRYLHSFGIIHRDLAPKNVLVKNGTAKVSDFGGAKFVRLTSPRQQQHQVQSAMEMTRCPGTLLFMAPEALREAPDYDRPLDVFSLGVMMLSVLTGVMPGIELITAPHFVVVRECGQQVEEVIPETTRRARYLARLPDEHTLKPLIRRCLSNRPEDRPSAEQAHEEIKRFLAMLNSILPSQPSTAGTAVTRQLESISQQLSQQATCIADITARSSAVEDQLSTITQRLVDTQLETTAIRGQLQTTNQHVTEMRDRQEVMNQQVTGIRGQLQTTNQQVTGMQGQLQTTNQQVTVIRGQLQTTNQHMTEMRDRQATTNQHVTKIRDRLETTNQQVTGIRGQLQTTNQHVSEMHDRQEAMNQQVTSLQGDVAVVATEQTDLRTSIREQLAETNRGVNDQLSHLRSTLESLGSGSDSGRSAMASASGESTSGADTRVTRNTPVSSAQGSGADSGQSAMTSASRGQTSSAESRATRATPVSSGQGSGADSGRSAMTSASRGQTSSAESGATRTTPVSSVGDSSRQHSAAPAAHSLIITPDKIRRITMEREWIEAESNRGAELIVHNNTLVAVWLDDDCAITSIQQTTDIRHWTDLPLPHHGGLFKLPSLASNGQVLYMYCLDNQYQAVLLQYNQHDRQWVEVAKVPPVHGQHHGCAVHDTDTSVSLLGGYIRGSGMSNCVSCYTLLDQQWKSSAVPSHSLPALPCGCAYASLVACHGSLYIIGGNTGCFLQYTDDGHWQKAVKPDGVDLKNSRACSLSDGSLVIASYDSASQRIKCTVYNVRTHCADELPSVQDVWFGASSLALLNGVVVLSTSDDHLYTLDMNI
ncbi:serine/threonine-protein kinase dst1-like isoform X1 [Sycon ciliatum]|uniref:serine/threonine-protein kinase dst1-like isoform X1 n=1 Tax=Sycon ciliatum TaxID=27933 RepID=UPI0031F65749